MREQVCKYMCPYARFQSAMFDKDTLIITYDQKRGEPRGKAGPANEKPGDCIDCGICVQVCPTGIDIRKGLQYECIGCAACIDGCDQVMDKLARPRKLIRYSTTHALEGRPTRVLRPRVLVYASILALIVIASAASLYLRVPLKVDVIRDRAAIAREVDEGEIENVYRLQIMNTTEQPRSYEIRVEGMEQIRVASEPRVAVDAAASRLVPVRVRARVASGPLAPGGHPITFTVSALGVEGEAVREKSVFIVR
jgi:cytochrome c oxidase accessory protein FixG